MKLGRFERRKMKKTKNILFWLATAVLVLAIALAIIPKLFGVQFCAVLTGSMEPELSVGSLVVIVPTSGEEIKIGDDVAFLSPGKKTVTHRVVENNKEDKTITTWGIANARSAIDAPSSYKNVLGVVKVHVPFLGRVLNFLSTTQGKVILTTGILSIYILSMLLSSLRKDDDENEKDTRTVGETMQDEINARFSLTKLKEKKKIILLTLTLMLTVSLLVGGTAAYFTHDGKARNTFTMGSIEIALDEPNWHGNGKNIKPATTLTKDPTVTNLGGESYMRIRMEIVDGDGNLIEDKNRINLILQTLYHDMTSNFDINKSYSSETLKNLTTSGKLSQEYNKKNFTFVGIQTGKPAIRYYNFTAGDGIFGKTKNEKATLFTHFVVPNDWHNDKAYILNGDTYTIYSNGRIEVTEAGSGYKLVFVAEAIQAAEYANAQTAYVDLDKAMGITREFGGA